MVPLLFFQVVLLESASRAGARLAIPSLATPIGSVIARIVMSRYGRLIAIMRIDSFLIAAGSADRRPVEKAVDPTLTRNMP